METNIQIMACAEKELWSQDLFLNYMSKQNSDATAMVLF